MYARSLVRPGHGRDSAQLLKKCCVCREQKPYSEFHKARTRGDGFANRCKDCQSSYQKAWRVGKEDSLRAYGRAYFRSNRETFRASRKEYYARNKDSARIAALMWAKMNPGRASANKKKYKVLKSSAIPKWADFEKISLVYEKARALGWEVDHVVPLNSPIVCGLHVWENLQLLDRGLNAEKSNKAWPDQP